MNGNSDEGWINSIVCSGWDNSEFIGSWYRQLRCPRFFDQESAPMLVRPYQPEDREAVMVMYRDVETSGETFGLLSRSNVGTRAWLDCLTSNGWNLLV